MPAGYLGYVQDARLGYLLSWPHWYIDEWSLNGSKMAQRFNPQWNFLCVFGLANPATRTLGTEHFAASTVDFCLQCSNCWDGVEAGQLVLLIWHAECWVQPLGFTDPKLWGRGSIFNAQPNVVASAVLWKWNARCAQQFMKWLGCSGCIQCVQYKIYESMIDLI